MSEGTEGDMHLHAESKPNKMARCTTEETGAQGDVYLHTQRKMDEMAQKMFEEE